MADLEYEELCSSLERLQMGPLPKESEIPNGWRHCLLIKISYSKTYSIPVIARSLTNIWKTTHQFQIFSEGINIFKVIFVSMDDLEKILDNTPWKISKNNLIILERVLPDKLLEDYLFDRTEFWIQFYGLPTNRLNIQYISDLAANLGKVHPIPPALTKN